MTGFCDGEMPTPEETTLQLAKDDSASSSTIEVEKDSKDNTGGAFAQLEARIKSLEVLRPRIPSPFPPHLGYYPHEVANDSPETIEPVIFRIPAEQWRSFKTCHPNSQMLPPIKPLLLVSVNSAIDIPEKLPICMAITSISLINNLNRIFGNMLTLQKNVLVWPFKPLISYKDRIRSLLNRQKIETDESGGDHLASATSNHHILTKPDHLKPTQKEIDEIKCLVEFMDDDLGPTFDIFHKIQTRQVEEIAFYHLWFLFKPGDLVLSASESHGPSSIRAYRVLQASGARFRLSGVRTREDVDGYHYRNEYPSRTKDRRLTSLTVSCFCIDFDGYSYGPSTVHFTIAPYSGTRPILSLEVYPANFDPDFETKKEMLLQRGLRYANIGVGVQKQYSGRSIREQYFAAPQGHFNPTLRSGQLTLHAQEVDCRVVIDQELGIDKLQETYKTEIIVRLGTHTYPPVPPAERDVDDVSSHPINAWGIRDTAYDDIIDVDRQEYFMSSSDLFRFRDAKDKDFADDFLVLLPWRIYGYTLMSRKWLPLHIDCIKDINDSGNDPNRHDSRFEDLVLPRGHKQLLEALVKYQSKPGKLTASGAGSLDVVRGKGDGLIILLHGSPGVGKTSTAECVAAHLNRPLLPITCGDLGDHAAAVESKLEEFCFLAEKWNCVLLLDEADVFLSKREKGDFFRNSLVSVFLRTIEYYPGVLILTTNRVGEIDEAFRSRIHICLFYPKLDQSSTYKIWEKYLARLKDYLPAVDVDEDDIRQFYEGLWKDHDKKPSRRWNGRQIKNAFQTALALAEWEFRDKKIDSHLGRPVVRARHFRKMAVTSAHFDDYFAAVHGLELEDAYGILAARDEVRTENAPLISFVTAKDRRKLALARRSSTLDSDGLSGGEEDPSDFLIKGLEEKLFRAKALRRTEKLLSSSKPVKDIFQDSDEED